MAFLFGGDNDKPQPAPVPQSPMASEDGQAARVAAQDAALAQSRAAGRQQTVAAGRDIAQEDQQTLGTVNAKRRASRELTG